MIKLDRLKAQLHTSGLQQKDNSLFQVISQLIDAVRQFEISIIGVIPSSSSSGGGLVNSSYLTNLDESSSLPNSKQLIAGERITFDDSALNQRTLDVPIDEVILTGADESATLPNSRRLLAGTNIVFDDSIVNERTIDVSGVVTIDYVIATMGVEPGQILTDGFGSGVYVPYTP